MLSYLYEIQFLMNCEIISNYNYFSLNIFEKMLINQFEAPLLKLTNLVKKDKILMVSTPLEATITVGG